MDDVTLKDKFGEVVIKNNNYFPLTIEREGLPTLRIRLRDNGAVILEEERWEELEVL